MYNNQEIDLSTNAQMENLYSTINWYGVKINIIMAYLEMEKIEKDY